MCVAAEPRAVDVSSSHQFEEEIVNSSSEHGLFIDNMKFSIRTRVAARRRRAINGSSESWSKRGGRRRTRKIVIWPRYIGDWRRGEEKNGQSSPWRGRSCSRPGTF